MKNIEIKFRRKLAALLKHKGISSSPKIQAMAAFLLKVMLSLKQAIVMAPCGIGKTLCAIAWAAASATTQFPVLFIVQDRRTMFNIRNDLALIMDANDVGLYAGWSDAECHALNPGNFKFGDCLRDARDSACPRCTGRLSCNYWQSRRQLGRPVVVTTRAAFMILFVKNHDFSRHVIICDEDLMVFADEAFKVEELNVLQRVFSRHDSFSDVSGLLAGLFPTLSFSRFAGLNRTADTHIRFMTQANWDRTLISRIVKFIKADPRALKQYEELVFRFLGFFRTCAACGASYAYVYDGDMLYVKKSRLDLKMFTGYRQFIVLNASAALSLNEFAPDTQIVTCADLDKYREAACAELYVIAANPTMSRRRTNIARGLSMLGLNASYFFAGGPDVLMPYNISDGDAAIKAADDADIAEVGIIREFSSLAGYAANVCRVGRGQLRGYNEYRNCSSAFFVAASFFTTVADYAMHAVLRTGADMALTEVVNYGKPVMHKGRFRNADVQDVFMRKSLDELYQALFRTAIRDGRDVRAMVALPSPEWLVPLRMLMRFKVVEAEHPCPQTVQAFMGLSQLINLEPGSVVRKREAAAMLGYEGDTGWRDHRNRITGLLESYFEIPRTGYDMVRRGMA